MAKLLENTTLPISLSFTLSLVGLIIAAMFFVAGVSTAANFSQFLLTVMAGSGLAISFAYALISLFDSARPAMIVSALLGAAIGLSLGSAGAAVLGIIMGVVAARLVFWVHYRQYRRGLPIYLTSNQVLWHYGFRGICGMVFVFLITPILVVLPLSFNAQDFFTFTPEMLRFDPEGYSLKHYRDFFTNNEWQRSFKNSLIIAPIATVISVSLGTLAAIGLSQSHVPFRRAIMAILISPMIVPLIISATGMFFFYSTIGNWLEDTLGLGKNLVGYIKVILAHAVLGIPFVIITVTATLVGFDRSLTRAAANMGANPLTTFFKVQMPLILPGVVSGALFAFITSFDEVVVVLFVGSASQKTLPWQMFIGLREQISPTILAVATILVVISICLLTTLELLRRRSERLRGITPS
ncbi:Polyamine ABC transporter, permease protein [hydrothermal vent metagenome]|uniref:Polyamine ABC transporter, permease protein n=1 Tax=hydrothermal vent metagenome TaxID=652676 RepID=A0A3B0SJJ4_9ZZZZ